MSEKTNYKSEKMTEAERKKKISVETQNPVPSVPNRAHTEMSTRHRTEMSTRNLDDFRLTETSNQPFGESGFYVNTKRQRNKDENAKKHMETE